MPIGVYRRKPPTIDVKRKPTYEPGSVADLIERYIREMNARPNALPLGKSHAYTLRKTQRSDLGPVNARALTHEQVKTWIKKMNETVSPATAMQSLYYLSGVLAYAGSEWPDCNGLTNAAVLAAKPSLLKNGYIGKSTPRTRVPTDDEIERLLARAALPPKKAHAHFISAMPDIIAFALVSTRRIGEICRITHADVEWDHLDEAGNAAPIYWVRNMKHPTKKMGNDKSFTLFPELAEIIRRQLRKPGDDRIFPFYDKSVGAKYTRFKKELGIEDLHFHDNRREAITNWLKKLPPHKVRKFLSGHTTGAVFDRVYDATDAADGHALMRLPDAERMVA